MQEVAGVPGDQAICFPRRAKCPSQLGQPDLHAGCGPVRGIAWPKFFGQPVGRDDLIGMHEEHRKHGAGPRAAHLKRLPAGRHFEGTKDVEVQCASSPGIAGAQQAAAQAS